ncbi:ABC-type phosphate transport system auxiliary subunit [Parabacteroides sp. PFB2-12]|uniref:hypothetical protein n=1 Tax=unclassified Parabacteroides TaxID=2649774 RepID=UPI00247610D9|nr:MULTISPECIES: hypothetical protein [unclassified Parabacteroides]MDH6341908.1 ABC-type phosphate transport system auxiliary subunit [Parabacteroides sp. PM6-13]MDH6389606.1 ABC-type phosphate transport system auxiliary subunit [Parabacteroides sp. PFB2-12]
MKRNNTYTVMQYSKWICLLLAFTCMGMDVLAQETTNEPQPEEYFDLIGERDGNGNLRFVMGKDEVGFLRDPNDYAGYNELRYYIFTNKRLIRVSDSDSEGLSGIRTVVPFDSLVINDVYKKGGSKSLEISNERPRGYKKINSETFVLKDGNNNKTITFFVVNTGDWDWKESEVRIAKNGSNYGIQKLTEEESMACDSIFMSGDSIALEVKRKLRGLIQHVTLAGKTLEGKYRLQNDNTLREKDDIAPTAATFMVDKAILPAVTDTTEVPLKITFGFVKDGSYQQVVKTVNIKVAPKKEDSKIVAWLGTIYGKIIGGFFLILILIIILAAVALGIKKGFHLLKKRMRASQSVITAPQEDVGPIIPPLEKVEEPKGNVPLQVFDNLSDNEGANLLKEYLLYVYPSSVWKDNESELKNKIYKSWVRQCCKELNKIPLVQIDKSQYTADNLSKTIEEGFIGQEAKSILDAFRDNACQGEKDYKKILERYQKALITEGQNKAAMSGNDASSSDSIIKEREETIRSLEQQAKKLEEALRAEQDKNEKSILAWQDAESKIRKLLMNLRSMLKEQRFDVEDKEPQTVFEAIQLIETAVKGGVNDPDKQVEIDDLKQSLADVTALAEKEKEQAKNDLDAQNKLFEEEKARLEEEHTKVIEARKEELQSKHEKELQDKENEYQEKIEKLQNDHMGVLGDKDGKIDKLGVEIGDLKMKMEELGKEAHSDCAFYIQTLMDQMNAAQKLMDILYQTTCNTSGEKSQYANVIRKVKESFEKFGEQVNQRNTPDQWGALSTKLPQVREELQDFIAAGLRNTGWVNMVNYLHLYAGASQELNDSFNANGLSTTALAQLCADTQRMIGLFGVKVVVPHLLVDKFDVQSFDFDNGDKWIQSFAADLRPKDYESRVFDMSCIGYQIEGNSYNKPKVFYL